MHRVMIAVFVLGFAACTQSEGGTTAPTQDSETGAEAPATESTEAEVEAEPTCGRNSSEICECAAGGSGLRVCLEGAWADCVCEDDGFDNDDLAFDDE